MTIEEAYHILGFDSAVAADDIRKAYRRLALELHPDKFESSHQKDYYASKFKELKDAYEFLKREGYPPLVKPSSETRPVRIGAGRRRTFVDTEQLSLPEKLGLRFSWDMDSLTFWILMLVSAAVLAYVVRLFSSLLNR